jgi:hypothetical protein
MSYGVPSPSVPKIVLYPSVSKPPVWPSKPSLRWVLWAPSPGVKRPGCEGDYLLPSRAEAKKTAAIPPLPYTSSWRSK